MKLITTRFLFVISTLFLFSFSLYGQRFDRRAELPASDVDPGGFGGIVSGVDFDGDGKPEFYAVNNGWDIEVGRDMIPRIYKYEWNEGRWEIVWWTETDITLQNTWPALTYGDWDNDGKMEIIWGPVNNFGFQGVSQTNPPRVLVFESAGDGSDVMGVLDPATGNYRPNAQWTIVDGDGVNIRPFRWLLHDIDNDGTEELCSSIRQGGYAFLVISVDNIPDDGDGSETWELEASGKDSEISANTYYDIVAHDSSMYLFRSNGDVSTVTYHSATDTFSVTKTQVGLVPGGSWKSASLVDIDDNGEMEIVVGGWSSSAFNEVWVLEKDGDSLSASSIGRPGDLNGGRLYGGDWGDVDGDGNMDFIFGSRSSNPNASIYRVEYQGGDITDPTNYEISVIDHSILPVSGRFDVISVGNVNRDDKDEILYAGIPSNVPPPIVVLEHVVGNQPVIQNVADVPNDNGRQAWVTWWGAADDVGGLRLDAGLSGANSVPPVETVGHGRGTFTLDRENNTLWYMLEVYNIDSVAQAHIHLGGPAEGGGVVAFLFGPVEAGGPMNGVIARGRITADDLTGALVGDWQGFVNALLNGNTYVNVHTATNPGGEIRGQILTRPREEDSSLSKTSGFTITHYVVWRIDGRGPGPVPVQVARVDAIQSPRYAAVVPTLSDGDSTRSTYVVSAHTENVLTLWKSFPKSGFSLDNLAPSAPTNVLAKEVSGSFVELTWDESQDEDFNYFLVVKGTEAGFNPETAENIGSTTETTLTDEAVSIGQTFYYRVAAVDFNGNQSVFSEEVSVIVTSVNESSLIPTEYSLEQNYPNPFNPTTTINFSIKDRGHVLLKIYSMLGREVATLADKEYEAGRYSVVFDASQMSSGVYFYILRVNGITLKNKMSLLK
ncbi:CHRD domain-containing protein [candidate division KSB1 bacterium]|nr:CHRD domain-containing protein [candidate division KSB1 bacterium]